MNKENRSAMLATVLGLLTIIMLGYIAVKSYPHPRVQHTHYGEYWCEGTYEDCETCGGGTP